MTDVLQLAKRSLEDADGFGGTFQFESDHADDDVRVVYVDVEACRHTIVDCVDDSVGIPLVRMLNATGKLAQEVLRLTDQHLKDTAFIRACGTQASQAKAREDTLRAKLEAMSNARDVACAALDKLLDQIGEIMGDEPKVLTSLGVAPDVIADAMRDHHHGMRQLREVAVQLRAVGREST